MTRALAFVLLAGCAVAAAWLALPHDHDVRPAAVAAGGGASLLCAALLLVLPSRLLPDRALKVTLAMVTANVSVSICFAGAPGTGLELFYLWATPYAWYFFSCRHAVLQTAWAASAYAAALTLQQALAGGGWPEAARELPGRWLVMVGTLAIVGVLVRRLAVWMREREARFRRGFGDSPFGMALVGTDLRYREVNDALCEIHGRSREQLLATTIEDVTHPGDRAITDAVMRNSLRGGPTRQSYEKRYVRPDGGVVLVSVHTSVVRDEGGEPLYFFSQVEDITERRRNEEELSRRADQQQAVARLGHAALRETDLAALMSEVVTTVSATLDVELCKVLEVGSDDAGLRLIAGVGWAQELSRGAALPADQTSHVGFTLISERPVVVIDLATETRFAPSDLLRARGVVSGLAVAIHGREAPFGVLAAHTARSRAFSDDDVNFVQAVANVLSTAVERHRYDERHRRAALHDALTGLANRTLAVDRIGHALRRRAGEHDTVAVLALDLDRFKLINDSLGHAAGDELLVALAARLRNAVRPSDTVARFGGDEFVVVCDGLEGPEAAVAVAERLSRAISEPVALRSGEHFIGASIGIALACGGDRETPDSLLRDADAAMYRVKERGGGDRYELFDEHMRDQVLRRVRTESDLRRALEGDELRVHYQPIVDVETGRPLSVEALVRWEHPQRGLIPPSEFIGIAEDTGLIADLGLRVLDVAAAQVAEWQRRFGIPLGLAVNVSGRQLARGEFPAHVAAIVARSGLAPGTLALEITESVLIEEADGTMAVLAQLREHGMRLILDDFGTGYSSLAYLKRFALHGLKIDRSFIDGLGTEDDDLTIVEAVIRMAHSLGLDVVAEGVETEAQLSQLRRLGCPNAQGYLFARPLPPAEMGALLGERLAVVAA
jgi:diguanylate cyclase (GGDEF)-like protein/PAS domain S-box-containing protein